MSNASEILSQAGHRPWPLPQQPWVMQQCWSELLFAHWPIDPERLRLLLPVGLEVDTFDGQGWFAVVPFQMEFRLRGLSWPCRFQEINVRTYVRYGNKPGVFFFSLDANDWPTVLGARGFFSLPYYFAHMQLNRQNPGTDQAPEFHFTSERQHQPTNTQNHFEASYRPISPVTLTQSGTLEYWLTERYCLYSTKRDGSLYRCEVHHPPWPLQPAEAEIRQNTMLAGTGLAFPDNGQPPLLHYAERVDVLVWPLQKLS